MKKIYVCSQYRGDIETNVQNAKDYCGYVVKEGVVANAKRQGQQPRCCLG